MKKLLLAIVLLTLGGCATSSHPMAQHQEEEVRVWIESELVRTNQKVQDIENMFVADKITYSEAKILLERTLTERSTIVERARAKFR